MEKTKNKRPEKGHKSSRQRRLEESGMFMTTLQVAKESNMSEGHVRNWIRRGKLKASKFGCQWLILREDAENFDRERKVYKKRGKTTEG